MPVIRPGDSIDSVILSYQWSQLGFLNLNRNLFDGDSARNWKLYRGFKDWNERLYKHVHNYVFGVLS